MERNATEQTLLHQSFLAAKAAGHVFPEAAACEGAVETASKQPDGYYRWFTSQLYVMDHNVFGEKQHVQPIFETVMRPTQEYLHGHWQTITAPFIKFPSDEAAFSSRMATLKRLQGSYPHYAAALAAKTPEDYLTQVSQTWSTGPERAMDCIAILHQYKGLLV